MTLEFRTIINLIQVFFAYFLCSYVSPAIIFHNYLRNKTLSQKFIICTLIGNFYMVNIVFFIFLLGIPGKYSLFLFTFIPAIFCWRKINRPQIGRFFSLLIKAFTRLILGETQIKTIFALIFYQPRKLLLKFIRSSKKHIKTHFLEWIILSVLLAFDLWYYSYQTVTKYVYGTSDLVVHHNWIANMDNGTIFCKGIYPFGFHNVMYFLHTIFGFDLMTLLRTFGSIQMLFIYLMLYVLLKKICHSKFVPLFAVFLFTLPNIFDFQGTMRYQWALPQEFGMIFLYPCAYFLMAFFENKKIEIQTEKNFIEKKQLYLWKAQYFVFPSTKNLILFGMSFSLTLAVHFYITIIAVFLCLAIALAYFPIVFYYRYFFPIVIAGLLSIFSAVLPMGTAYLQGTQLQGSLLWAIGMMSPGTNNSTSSSSEESSNDASEASSHNTSDSSDNISNTSSQTKKSNNGLLYKIKGYIKMIYIMTNTIFASQKFTTIFLDAFSVLFVLSFIFVLFRRSFYCHNLFGILLYCFFMIIIVASSMLPIPMIMDITRSRIFLVYAVPLLAGCTVDLVYTILGRPFRFHPIFEVIPVSLILSLSIVTITLNQIKPINIYYSLMKPEEMKCNYDIINDYPQKKWTIVTTTNSLELIENKGWHMELCSFLGKMNHYNANSKVIIPTKYVFFYIEKKPLDYAMFTNVNQAPKDKGMISSEAAKKRAQYSGSDVYTTENRYILESKFFYWAKAFQQKYPAEFQVYYENDNFICYRIVQNEYHLYNFAINYHYN